MKILIVDDDPGARKLLRLLVEAHGHGVIEASDGQEGLEKALQHKPDAIISDALMPKLDGFRFLRAVRQDETLCALPFVFYTGIYTEDKEYELALSLGADALIVKPKAPADFWKEFTSALDAHASKRKPAPQTRPLEKEEDYLRDYCRLVAAKLEEKVRELETVVAVSERTNSILQESEQRYRLLFESNPHPMWVYDLDTLAFLTVNDVAVSKYGYSREEFLSMTLRDIRPPEDIPALLEKISKKPEGFDEAGIWRHLKKDGTVIYVEIASYPMIFAGRRAELISAIDVTGRKQLEDALKAAVVRAENEKARADSVIAAIGDGVTIQDRDFRIVYQNQAFKEMLGDHLGELCFMAYEHREKRCEGCGVALVFEDGEVHTVLRSAPTAKGTLYVEITASPLRDSKGNIIAGIEVVHNITKRRKMEEALERQKQFTENLIQNSAVATFVLDADHSILIWNRACEELTGFPAFEMLGTNAQWIPFYDHERPVLADIVLSEDPENSLSAYPMYSKSILMSNGLHAEGWYRNLNGRDRYIMFDAAPIYNPGGKVIAAIETLQDITERKLAEDLLKKEKNRAQKYLDIAGVMIVALDSGGRITLINKKGLEILGYEEPEVIDQNWFELCIPGRVREELKDVFNELMAGDTELIEYHQNSIVIKGGGERIIAFHNTILRNEAGKIYGVLFSGEDITEQRRNSDELYERVHQAALAAEIGVVLTRGGDLRTTLQLCAGAMVRYLEVAFARIWTLNEIENVLEMQASAGMYTHINGAHSRVPVGKFKIGLIAEERKPHLTNQVIGDPRVSDQEWAIKEGMTAFAGYPLIVQDRLVGVMAMFSRKRIAEAMMSSLASVADVIALGIERKKSEESLASYSRELTALNTASNTLMLITNLGDIYQEICNTIYAVFDLAMVWVGIIEEGSYEVRPAAHCGYEADYLSAIRVTWDDSPTGMGPSGMAIKTKTPFLLHVDDPRFAPWREEAKKRGYVMRMAVPLMYARDKCIGVLNFYSSRRDYFNSDRIKLCQIFANQAAIAIENVRLIEELEGKVVERTTELEDANRELQSVNMELVLRREEADAASSSKTDFLANMSHELRTPLNAIMGFSDIMQQGMAGPVTDKQKEFLNDISESGNHLLTLINDILDLSKIEAGKLELEPGTVSLKEIIESSLSLFKEKALKHAIKATAEIDNTVTRIIADQKKLKQVIVNLLSNAFKFTPDGGSVHVAARRISSEVGAGLAPALAHTGQPQGLPLQERDFVEISVTDTGIGISKEHQQKLFQPFHQIETSLTRKYAGTGLGLSLCRRFVELHGGRIWVESEPGKGSRFVFIIPMKQ